MRDRTTGSGEGGGAISNPLAGGKPYYSGPMSERMRDLLLISVGNSRTRCAIAAAGELQPSVYLPNEELATLPERLRASADAASDDLRAIIASVNDPVARQVEEILEGAKDLPVTGTALRMGRDVPIPVEHTLPAPVTVGQDRLLNALGAFSRSEQACIVIDAGTAVTVDFVDGHGVFQGGAIAPGVRMMLRALHEHTAALPEVTLSPANLPGRGGEGDKGREPWGKTTAAAMTLGVVAAVRGLAHELIDRYAEHYEAYPRVVATGGDAPLLFDGDALVEHIVPDLTLIGMLAACRIALEADTEED